MKTSLNSLTIFSLLLMSSFLVSCAETFTPVKVTLLQPPAHKIITQNLEQPVESTSVISEEERMLALQGKASEFNQTEKAHLDALTAYIEKYQVDPVMLSYVEKAKKCAKVAGFYQAMPKQYVIVSELSKDYSYTCPYVVARFIDIVESGAAQ